MAASTTRNLFLQVSADTTPLTAAAKGARSALLTIGDAANDIAEHVEKGIRAASGTVANGAKQMERSFDSTFANIRRNAAAVMEAPTGKAALQIIDAAGVEQAAKAAETQAAALRRTADAAAVVAQRAGATGDAERVLAVATEAAAQQAEKHALAMRGQATVMTAVAAEVRAVSGAEVDANEEIAGSHRRMGASGMIAEHVVRSLSDSIAAGQSPARALGMEMGRITEAMTMFAAQTDATEGMLGKFAGFMGGPWGLAVSVGVAVLLPLITGLAEAGNAAEDEAAKLRKNAEDTHVADLAKAAFARTQDGLISATRELTKELDKQNESLRTNAERQNIASRQTLNAMQGRRPGAVEELSAAQAARQAAMAASGTHDNPGALAAADARVAAAQAALAALDRGIADASTTYQRSRVDLAAEQAKRDADPVAKINHLYDERIRLARAAADAAAREGNAIGAATKAKLVSIELERKAAVEAEQERQRLANRKPNDRQVGREINLSQAEDIIHGIGGRITSTTRTRDQQQVLYDRYQAFKAGTGPWAPLAAKPGTSEHETGQALDIAMGGGMTLAKIRAAFEKNGVRITELLNEGDHFHVAWGRKGPSQESVERRQQAAEDKHNRDAEAYTQMLDRAQQEQVKLTRGQVTTPQAGADLDVQALRLERERLDSAAQAGVLQRRWTQAQADALKQIYARNEQIAVESVRDKEGSALLDQQLAADRDQLDRSNTMLQLQNDLADTVKARKAIALQLLANQEQAARDAAIKLIGSDDPVDQAKGDAAMRDIDATHSLRVRQIDRQYQSPMDSYREQLTGSVGDMGEAMDQLKAHSLKGVEDGLVGILSGTKSVAQGFRDMADQIIADLARIAVEKLILSVIGLKGGGAIADIPGFAGGGEPSVDRGVIRGPGTGTSDSILAVAGGRRLIRVANGEGIVNERGMRKHRDVFEAINADRLPAFADGGAVDGSRIFMRALPTAAAMARPVPPPQFIYVTTDKSALFDTHVTSLAAPLAQAAMAGGAQQAQQDMADDAASRIPT